MSVQDVLKEFKETRQSVRNLRKTVKQAGEEDSPNGTKYSVEEVTEIAEAAADVIDEFCDLVKVGAENRQLIIATIKAHFKPAD